MLKIEVFVWVTHFDLFLFIQNDFLQHIARAINSSIITVNMQWESR